MSDIPFSNLIKGRIAETLIKNILQESGYRVARLGIEEQIPEITHLSGEDYHSLNVPRSIRSMPDLLVLDLESKESFLVEVKFRSELSPKVLTGIKSSLKLQEQYWSEAKLILLCSDREDNDLQWHQHYIRVLESKNIQDIEEALALGNDQACNALWKKLPMLGLVFQRFDWKKSEGNRENCIKADTITRKIKELGNYS